MNMLIIFVANLETPWQNFDPLQRLYQTRDSLESLTISTCFWKQPEVLRPASMKLSRCRGKRIIVQNGVSRATFKLLDVSKKWKLRINVHMPPHQSTSPFPSSNIMQVIEFGQKYHLNAHRDFWWQISIYWGSWREDESYNCEAKSRTLMPLGRLQTNWRTFYNKVTRDEIFRLNILRVATWYKNSKRSWDDI